MWIKNSNHLIHLELHLQISFWDYLGELLILKCLLTQITLPNCSDHPFEKGQIEKEVISFCLLKIWELEAARNSGFLSWN